MSARQQLTRLAAVGAVLATAIIRFPAAPVTADSTPVAPTSPTLQMGAAITLQLQTPRVLTRPAGGVGTVLAQATLTNNGADPVYYLSGCGVAPLLLLRSRSTGVLYRAQSPEPPVTNTCVPTQTIVAPHAGATIAGFHTLTGVTDASAAAPQPVPTDTYDASMKLTYTIIRGPAGQRYLKESDGSLIDTWPTTWTLSNPSPFQIGVGAAQRSTAAPPVPASSTTGPFHPKVLVLDYNTTGAANDGSAALTTQLIAALGTGSKYHNGATSAAQFQIYATHVENNPPPLLSAKDGSGYYLGNYQAIFTKYNVCGLAASQGVDFVWIWAGGNPAQIGDWPEWVTTGPTFNITYGTNEPTCPGHTVTTEVLNYTRAVAEALHSTGHYTENVLQYGFGPSQDLVDRDPGGTDIYDLFDGQVSRYGGYKGPLNTATAECGDVHFPPNATFDYDYGNATVVLSDCASFNPGVPSAESYRAVSVATWQALPCNPSQTSGSLDCYQQSYLMWWMQQMPGYGNATTDCGGSAMPNWWQYIVALDSVVGVTNDDCSRFAFAPGKLQAAAPDPNHIVLTWTDNSTNESGFRLSNGTTTWTVAANTTSYTVSGLQPGTYRCNAVQAYNSYGGSAWTPWTCITTPLTASPPAAPSRLQATAPDPNHIVLTWADNSNDESGFRLTNGTTTWSLGPDITTYTVSGLQPGTFQCYAVYAYNGSGNSGRTPQTCITTPLTGAPPTAPSNLKATATDATHIVLTWTDNSTTELGFHIANGITVPANTTSYTVSGLQPGTYQCYAVQAYNSYGNSAWTPWACVTTPLALPAAPSNLQATAQDSTHILLTWTRNSTDESGFQFWDGISYWTVPAGTTSYVDSTVPPATYRCYQIRAYNSAGYSAWTPYACTTTPPATPSNPVAQDIDSSSIYLTWTNVSTATSILVYDGSTYIATLDGTSTRYVVRGLAPNSYNCLAVVAYLSGAGDSGWSNWACTTTLGTGTTVPGGEWISPPDGQQVSGDTLAFQASAYPVPSTNPPIDHVVFTVWWPALGPQSGPWAIGCIAYPTSGTTFSCSTDLSKLGAPHGQLLDLWPIYQRSGLSHEYRRPAHQPGRLRLVQSHGRATGRRARRIRCIELV